MKLAGKTAFITGGNSGIGRAVALRFAAEGARVAIAARTGARSDHVVHEVRDAGGDAISVGCDVTDQASVTAAVAGAYAALGSIDVLVNNAGVIYREKTVPDTTADEWDATFAVNTRGTFLTSKAVIPLMVQDGGGAIVNNASYFGLVGGRGAAAYAASKGAVVLLTKSMALDHARDGIRVNCVCAGSVDTPMLQTEMDEMGGESAVRHQFEDKHPLGRIARPEEVAAAITYLASDEAGFVTGAALPIDGGLTAG